MPATSTLLDELDASGLTGRGGAGFPTSRKVGSCATSAVTTRSSSSTPWRANRRRTRTGPCSRPTPTWCSTAPSCSPR